MGNGEQKVDCKKGNVSMNNSSTASGTPWRVSRSSRNVVNASVKPPKPSLVKGYWSDKNKKKIITNDPAQKKTIGETVYAYVQTIGIPDGTTLNLTIREWDPTFFDPDELITKVTAQVKNNCIHQKIIIDKKWCPDELDQVSEVYFQVEGEVVTKDDTYELDEEYPSDTDDYLYVADKGVPITILIKLPHSKSTDKVERKGLGGHTGIAIGQEFYDFGPNTSLYDKTHGPVTGVAGIPWWDQEVLDKSHGTLTMLEDVDLPQILDYIKREIKQDTYKVEFFVTPEQGKDIEKWWLDRYQNLGTYACLPWSGEQCTTTVRISLEKAGVIRDSIVQTPASFLDFLRDNAKNTAGKDVHKPARITQIQVESGTP